MMERRDFLKQFLPCDYKGFLKGGLLVLLLLFLFVNFSGIIDGTQSAIQLIGIVIGIVAGFVLALLVVTYLLSRLFKLLPAEVKGSLAKYQTVIINVLFGLILGYIIYDLVIDKRYARIIFMLVFITVYSIIKWNDKKAEEQ